MKKTEANFGTPGTRSNAFTVTKNGPRSVSYTYTSANDPNEFQETIHLTYDIDRPTLAGGDLLVRDGHFVHFISPDNLPPIAKNVIFVLDTSGSMSYQDRMNRLKIAFNRMINDLNPEDTFQVVSFHSSPRVFYSGFQKNTPENVANAVSRVSGLWASGGTNIYDALITSLNLKPDNNAANIIMLFTDGFPTSGPVTYWPTIRDRFTENNKVSF